VSFGAIAVLLAGIAGNGSVPALGVVVTVLAALAAVTFAFDRTHA
jgi:hypothetical protein